MDEKNEQEREKRILLDAAKILKRDIRSIKYNADEYPPSDKFLDNIENEELIPPSLIKFMTELGLQKNKSSLTNNKHTKFVAISHAIMYLMRPRSFISPLLLGLSVTLHRKFGKRNLIEMLNNLGFCESYNETQLYEASVAQEAELQLDEGAFIQYVNDNADFNTNTIDGKGTFHNLGRISVITPKNCVQSKNPITRLPEKPPQSELVKKGKIPIQYYYHAKKEGLQTLKIKIKNLN